MPHIIVIAHNIRSSHNVGSIFRSAECFGVNALFLTGYTPYPRHEDDARLPHLANKITRDIHKTALGAEIIVPFSYHETIPYDRLRSQGYKIVALEQHSRSVTLDEYHPDANQNIALILGEERFGITDEILSNCDHIVEIPLFGKKESLNVSVAAGIALYHLTQN